MSEADDILRGMHICKPPEALASLGSADASSSAEPSMLDAAVARARRLGALLQHAISFPAMLGMLLVGAVFGGSAVVQCGSRSVVAHQDG